LYQLAFRSSLPAYHTIEPFDVGLNYFEDLASPRFRLWKPKWESPTRFFPNLYYLTFGLENVDPYRNFEHAPEQPTTMQFMTNARTSYDTEQLAPELNSFGDVVSRPRNVEFKAIQPLLFTEASRAVLTAAPIQVNHYIVLGWLTTILSRISICIIL
jgi:hypothetical protein